MVHLSVDEHSLARPTRVHVLGIGGVGLSGLAIALTQLGCGVTGSDLRESPLLDLVREAGARVELTPQPHNAASSDWLVVPWGIPEHHPEVVAARGANVRVMHREEALAALFSGRTCLGVVGTVSRGAATVALARLLQALGQDTGLLVGAIPSDGAPHARVGDPMVVEVDERAALPKGLLRGLLVSDLEADHLGYYRDDVRQRLLEGCAEQGLDCVLPTATGYALVRARQTVDELLVSLEPVGTSTRCVLVNDDGRRLELALPMLVPQARGVVAAVAFALMGGRCTWDGVDAVVHEALSRLSLVGQADVRALAPLIVHDVRTHPVAIARLLADVGCHADAPPALVIRPFPHTFSLATEASWLASARGASQVWLLPPYPGGTGDEDARLCAWLTAAGIPASCLSDDELLDQATGHTLFCGGDDLGALAEELARTLSPGGTPPTKAL